MPKALLRKQTESPESSGTGNGQTADHSSAEAFLHELQEKKQRILGGSGSLIFVFAGLIIVGMAAIAFVYYGLILDSLTPQIGINAKSIANLLAEKLSYAALSGVPLAELRGMQEFIGEFARSVSAIAHIVITDGENNNLHVVNMSGKPLVDKIADFSSPIVIEDTKVIGIVHVYLSIDAFQRIVDDLKYEMLTLSTIALFLSIDLLNSFYVMRIYDPLTEIFNHLTRLCRGQFTRHLQLSQNDEVNALCRRVNRFISKCNEKFSDFFYDAEETLAAQIDESKSGQIKTLIAKVVDHYKFTTNRRAKAKTIQSAMSIKIPLLIFVMGQELTTAFLPIYFRQLTNSSPLSGDFMVGLTFVGFLFAPLISMYFSAHILKFFSMRSYLVAGAAICMGTLYLLAQADTIEQAIFIRTVNGLGYGLIFLGSQIHIARLSNNENRARNSAVFARTMYAAVFFCPVIGGILAEQLGYKLIFVLSAVICALAILAMLLLLQGGERKKLYPDNNDENNYKAADTVSDAQRPGLIRRLNDSRSIIILSLFGSVPVKVNHFGIIMFIMPLLLADLGFRVVEVGRVLMLFGFLLLVCMPMVGHYMDKHKNSKSMVIWGSLLSLLAIIALFFENSWVIIGAVALFGISQSMVTPALLTMVQDCGVKGKLSAAQYSAVIGDNLTAFRMFERLGLIISVLLLSVFIGLGSYLYAFGFILFCQTLSIAVLCLARIRQDEAYEITDDGDDNIPVRQEADHSGFAKA